MMTLPFTASQLSIVSDDLMKISPDSMEIRQARMNVGDRTDFLQTIRAIALKHSTHIVCFNAENMAGFRHAEAAMHYAKRSFYSGKPISNSFEMEALLFAAGSRQCNRATLFGIHEYDNRIFVCTYPANEHVWLDLSVHMDFVTGVDDEIKGDKEQRLKAFFDITDEELVVVGRTRIIDLILERLALLEVNR
jgi:KEOPS complex subunit Cgi121